MSSNRLIYDVETFTERTTGNKNALEYTEYLGKFEHGLRCGKDLTMGDRADISSELMGITRTASKCAAKDWNPQFYDYKVNDKKYSPPDACNITFGHIQACDHKQKMPKDSGVDKVKDK
jgi:hypothetical protein